MFSIIRNKHERGQSLVIIALAFFALVAVAALVIDGGTLYVNRRNAQTAADAAALAGAREMCVENGSDSAIQTIVNQYAITENGATTVESLNIDRTNRTILVQTKVETASFFSSLLGRDNNTVRANASAGCFAPATTKNLLPVAWSCQPPVGGSVNSCVIHSIPWNLFKDEIYPHYKNDLKQNGHLVLDEGDGVNYWTYADGNPNPYGRLPYLVMDDSTFNTGQCAPPIGGGSLICDFDGDGILDLTGGGDRGWLLLDGQNGASNLTDLILSGYPDPITLPQWFPNDSGAKGSVFLKAKNGDVTHPGIEGTVALVPVFNAYCLSTTAADLPTNASCDYQTGDLITSGSGQSNYFRVTGFAPFFVTCISSKPNEKCPAKNYAFATMDPNRFNNIATIEGYFVDGYIAGTGVGSGGFDLGVYILSLTP